MSKDEKVVVKKSNIGFTGLLTLLFIVLKLCNVITWSWWWVLSPLWIVAALWVLLTIIVVIIAIWAND